MTNIKKSWPTTCVALALTCSVLCLQALGSPAWAKTLQADRAQSAASVELVEKLRARHYEKRLINDNLSADWLDGYLAMVDGNRQIFMQADIDGFNKKYRNSLDNDVLQGDVAAGFSIFNFYKNRLVAQLELQLLNLPANVYKYNFDVDEGIVVDRKKSPWLKSQAEVDDLWRKLGKAAVLGMRLQNKTEKEMVGVLTKRYKNQLERLRKINSEDVFQIYMNALTELYDPHTSYMSPELSENFKISMSLKLDGIGAILNMEDDYAQVVRLVPAGPAAKQGELKPADNIIAVGQGKSGEMVDVVGWRLDEVVQLIRGEKGSTVRLEVAPSKAAGTAPHKVISIVRESVKLEEQAVKKSMLELKDEKGVTHRIGVLDIPLFYLDFDAANRGDRDYKSTTRDTVKMLNELVRDGAEGIVMDLRDNGGGSLVEARDLTGLFIDKGPAVQIRMADQQVYQEAKKSFSPFYEGPMVVLINRMSASASEIFAGALQDYGRALIVGSQSYGKGTVQQIVPLNHGKVKITESKFYRVSGDSTQNRGVTPDVLLPEIYDSKIIGESVSPKAMKWDSIPSVVDRKFIQFGRLLPTLQQFSAKRAANDPDFVYMAKQTKYDESLKRDTLSLNEAERRQSEVKDKAQRLLLVNGRRTAKGEEPFLNYEAMEKAATKESEIAMASVVSQPIKLDDPYLVESARVLLDVQKLMGVMRMRTP